MQAWPLKMRIFGGRHPIGDLQCDIELIERSTPAAEVAISGEWAALQTPQKLIDADPGQSTLLGDDIGGAVQVTGDFLHVTAAAFHRKSKRAGAFEAADDR